MNRKILLLISSLGSGGAERVTLNLAGRWADEGDDVIIATLSDGSESAYEIPTQVRVVNLDLARASRFPGQGFFSNISRLWGVRKLIIGEKPDIAIGIMTTAAILLALARTRQIVAIGSEHIYPPCQKISKVWSLLRKFTYGRLDSVTVLTEEGRDWVLCNTFNKSVAVIPNSINLPMTQRPPHLSVDTVSTDNNLLLGVGRLNSQKGWPRLLTAFSILAPEYPNWHLTILGEGPERLALEQLVKHLALGERVSLPGWAGNLSDWYSRADLLVMTSEFEGFPNALVEALAHGCPVVSVDCDTGPRDIISHEINGLLVPQGNEVALVAALTRIMRDDKLREQMSKRAPEILKVLDVARIDALWQALFESAADPAN